MLNPDRSERRYRMPKKKEVAALTFILEGSFEQRIAEVATQTVKKSKENLVAF